MNNTFTNEESRLSEVVAVVLVESRRAYELDSNRMKPQLPIAPLKTQDASKLGDLCLVLQDLHRVIDTCTRLLAELEQEHQDNLLIDALWTAALIRYVRCFASGQRNRIREEILADLPGDPIGTHRYFKDMRDKHIAHSVNPFEEITIGAVLSVDGRNVEGIAMLSRTLICINKEGVETLRDLAGAVQHKVIANAQLQQQELLSWARAQLTPASLGLHTPRSHHVGKSRS